MLWSLACSRLPMRRLTSFAWAPACAMVRQTTVLMPFTSGALEELTTIRPNSIEAINFPDVSLLILKVPLPVHSSFGA